ncbi:MAG: hypothetical protein HUK01_04745 [Bacteroidaceae bacterium]|nr:hypothetical protein [Bacteroidaceae bacterium]
MTQIVVNIEKPGVLSVFKKLVELIDGISIAVPESQKTSTRLKRAIKEAHKGDNFRTDNIDELMAHLTE